MELDSVGSTQNWSTANSVEEDITSYDDDDASDVVKLILSTGGINEETFEELMSAYSMTDSQEQPEQSSMGKFCFKKICSRKKKSKECMKNTGKEAIKI